jgi:hypothetical protein
MEVGGTDMNWVLSEVMRSANLSTSSERVKRLYTINVGELWFHG